MIDPENPKRQNDPEKGIVDDEGKEWENPRNPEETHDQRDLEQLERQLEEAKRRKENLTED